MKFGVNDLYMYPMRLSCAEFRENRFSANHIHIRSPRKCCANFPHYWPSLYRVRMNLVKIGLMSAVLYSVRKWIYVRNFHVHLLSCGTRSLHIMLLSIFAFCENRRRKRRTFLLGVSEITFTCIPWKREKNALVITFYCVEIHTICVWLLLR